MAVVIHILKRMMVAAITPPTEPAREPSVPVRSHTRKRPVNAKREALHERLRAELGR